jgi:hypothetical protein
MRYTNFYQLRDTAEGLSVTQVGGLHLRPDIQRLAGKLGGVHHAREQVQDAGLVWK